MVYDSVTKRPLDPAYVVVREGADDRNAITDLDGRYGFFLKAGQYTLFANKTHYEFPPKNWRVKAWWTLSMIYHGEILQTKKRKWSIGTFRWIRWRWNEFAKNQQGFLFCIRARSAGKKIFVCVALGRIFTLTLQRDIYSGGA